LERRAPPRRVDPPRPFRAETVLGAPPKRARERVEEFRLGEQFLERFFQHAFLSLRPRPVLGGDDACNHRGGFLTGEALRKRREKLRALTRFRIIRGEPLQIGRQVSRHSAMPDSNHSRHWPGSSVENIPIWRASQLAESARAWL